MNSIFTRTDKTPEPVSQVIKPASTEPAATAPAQDPLKRSLATAGALASTPVQRDVSVISKALKITGQLESSEDIQIEGHVEGDVRAVVVRIGTGAKVHGTVAGEEVELSGTVDGKIEARKVVLTSSAHVTGDIIHQDVSIQSGAYIDGHLKPEYGKGDSNVQPLKAKME